MIWFIKDLSCWKVAQITWVWLWDQARRAWLSHLSLPSPIKKIVFFSQVKVALIQQKCFLWCLYFLGKLTPSLQAFYVVMTWRIWQRKHLFSKEAVNILAETQMGTPDRRNICANWLKKIPVIGKDVTSLFMSILSIRIV